MTVIAKNLVTGTLLTGVAVKLYTVPLNTRTVLKSINIANPTGGALSATIWLAPANGGANSPYDVLPPKSVAAGDVYAPPGLLNQVLEPLSELWALGAGLTLRISGFEIT